MDRSKSLGKRRVSGEREQVGAGCVRRRDTCKHTKEDDHHESDNIKSERLQCEQVQFFMKRKSPRADSLAKSFATTRLTRSDGSSAAEVCRVKGFNLRTSNGKGIDTDPKKCPAKGSSEVLGMASASRKVRVKKSRNGQVSGSGFDCDNKARTVADDVDGKKSVRGYKPEVMPEDEGEDKGKERRENGEEKGRAREGLKPGREDVENGCGGEKLHDSGMALSVCDSDGSDDMYHGQVGISFGETGILKATSLVCSRLEDVGHDAHCTDMDTSGYSNTSYCVTDKSPSSYTRQQLMQGSPGLYPVAGPQTPPDASRDLDFFPGQGALDGGLQISSDSSRDFGTFLSQSPMCTEDNLDGKSHLEPPVKELPGTAKALFSSGVLEGFRVSYQLKGEVMLTGMVKDWGILCNCRSCKGRIIVPVSIFEKHAGSNAKHPSDNIFLENGQSLLDVVKAGRRSGQSKYVGTLRKVEGDSVLGSLRSVNGSVSASSKKENYGDMGNHCCERKSDSNGSRNVQPSHTRDNNLHKMLFQPGGLPDGIEVAYYMKGQRLLSGTKEGVGICCGCCNELISCSSFESHAGWGSRRNPYTHIYLSDGQSLHEYAVALAAKRHEETADNSSKDNDDICGECGDGGDLVLCDGCPGAYHTECVGLPSIPEGDWFCVACQEKNWQDKRQLDRPGVRGSGRLLSRGKGSERCQRVVKASKNAIGGCIVCKNGDFLKSGFGAKTVMLCDQCEREYHVGCMKEMGIADLQELPSGEWFCGTACKHIHNILEGLVLSGPEPVCEDIINAMLKHKQDKFEFTWQLLHGRRNDPQNGRILSEAATIFTQSFDPIVDASSGRNLIPPMVYSRSLRDQDFRGMYCAVLKKNETVMSAATIRVFGRQFAEMPLVATSTASRGQGYFQMLMANIERLLGVLQVEHLVLPAAEGAEGIWVNKFGFSKLQEEQLQQFGMEVQIMIFQGSSMLHKAVS